MGGGSSQPQYPAPVLAGLWTEANQSFVPTPYPNTYGAAANAYSTIGNISQNPNALYDSNSSNALGSWLNQIGLSSIPYSTSALQANNPYIGQALQQGFDPQGLLYNKLFQQQQDQTNASLAMSGVGNTPYGAGLMQQGDQNFDIAWQQAQLANQAQGAGTASSLEGAGANSLSSILGAIGNAGVSGTNIGQGVASFPLAFQQPTIQDYLAYLSGSSSNAANLMNATNQSFGETNQLFNTQVQQAIAENQQSAGALGGIGSLLGKVAGFGLSGGFG